MDDSTDHIDPASKRASFYAMNHGGTRNSLYDTATSLEYNPRPASSHNYLANNSNPRVSGHGYPQSVDARQNYGDVRKSASVVPGQRRGSRQDTLSGMYDEFDQGPGPYASQQTSYQPNNARDRSKGRAHTRVTSNEVVYDRF